MIWIIIFIIITLILLLISFRSLVFKAEPLESCYGDEGRIVAPLIFDQQNGIYRTTVLLGNNEKTLPFSVVPDTGSSTLIVSGPECQNCNHQDGVWDYQVGQDVGKGVTGIIEYGGGQKTTYHPWQAHLLNYEDGKSKEVNFGVIKETFSPDGQPLNVLGLQEREGGFLEGICGEKTVVFNFPRNRLYLGRSDDIIFRSDNTFISTFDMNKPKFGPSFPIAQIESMTINGLPIENHPNRAIFDTGTTLTYVSADLASKLREGAEITITFEDRSHDSYPSSVTFRIPPNSIAVGSLPLPSSMLIGNMWLREYGVAFQHDIDRFVFFRS